MVPARLAEVLDYWFGHEVEELFRFGWKLDAEIRLRFGRRLQEAEMGRLAARGGGGGGMGAWH